MFLRYLGFVPFSVEIDISHIVPYTNVERNISYIVPYTNVERNSTNVERNSTNVERNSTNVEQNSSRPPPPPFLLSCPLLVKCLNPLLNPSL